MHSSMLKKQGVSMKTTPCSDQRLISPLIVVVAYNRANALARLLDSLKRASYPCRPTVLISIEGEAKYDVIQIAHQFKPENINVCVSENKTRLGLKDHIIQCGDLSIKHGAVIILEDDLYVDRFFYHYAQAALNQYRDDINVAGIALCGREYNEYAGLTFMPMKNGYSTYMMQIPCSSGQCWTREQWLDFKDWYLKANPKSVTNTPGLPEVVKNWPESSWKKYFAAYQVCKNKYFVYPYDSYSTNCSDSGGEHIFRDTFLHQVSLPANDRPSPSFMFAPAKDPEIAYDAYMEPCGSFIFSSLGLQKDKVTIDLYGLRPIQEIQKTKYVLSRIRYGKPITSFPRAFRPVENNLLHAVHKTNHEEIFLCESSNATRSAIRSMAMRGYSYYAGMPLLTPHIIFRLLIELPGQIARVLLRRFGFPC